MKQYFSRHQKSGNEGQCFLRAHWTWQSPQLTVGESCQTAAQEERDQAKTCRTPDLRRLCWAYGKTVKDRMCRSEYWGRGSSRGENYMNLWLVPLILGKAWLVCACKLWPGKIQPTRVRGKKYPVLRQEQKSTCFQVANWRTSKFTRN